MKRTLASLFALFLAAAIGCAPADEQPREEAPATAELSPFQLEHGIGPYTEEVNLPPTIDPQLAAQGLEIFEMNCSACHEMEMRLVGPPLEGVTERRSPTFILNMIMNPEEMVRTHPEGQAMLAQYPIVMPYQNITPDEARAILEYLRTVE
jgi:mono/diheme cytochrome c family protein